MTGPQPNVRITLAGVFGVEIDGAPLPERELGSRKARTLLKLIAVHRGHLVPIDTITETLWPDAPPGKPAENVATLVSRLRAVFGAEAIAGGRTGYRLVPGPRVQVDVDEAQRLTAEAEARLAGEPALAATAAARALAVLERGNLLDDESDAPWADEARRALERTLRRARRAAWRAALDLGDPRSALAPAEAAVAADGLDEEAHRAIIEARYRAGESGEALAAYERLRTTLVEELGADPSPESQALYLAVLREDEAPGADRASASPAVRAVRTTRPSGDFVGRQDELDSLVKAWDATARGESSCVLITGLAGIGKTRLAAELADVAQATGGLVVHVRCYEAERSLFLEPIVEAVRSLAISLPPATLREVVGDWSGTLAALVPEIGQVLRPHHYERAAAELERRRVFEAVTALLRAVSRKQPLLLVLDDLHHAGESTLELMHFCLRRISTEPAMVIGTLRVEDAASVLRVLGDAARVIELGPLASDAIAELANAMGVPHLAGDVNRLTRGHTMFAIEALRAAADEGGTAVTVPDSLRAAVLTRVARCESATEELLRAAATMGAAFGLDVVASLLDIPLPEAAARAERGLAAGLLVEAGTGYEFANDLVREALYEATPVPTRVVRHRRLAELLVDRPEAAAEHAAAAGEWPLAVETWLRAASRAAALFANREADDLLTRAKQACTRLDDPVLTARVNIAAGRVRLALADYDGASADLAMALQLSRASGEDALEAEATEHLGWAAYFTGEMDRAHDLAERVAANATTPGPFVLAGRVRHTAGDLERAQDALEPVVAAEDPATKAVGMSYLGALLEHQDRFAEAATMLETAVDACRRHAALRPMLNAMFFGGMAHANQGHFDLAMDWFERLDKEATEFDAAYFRSRAGTSLAWVWRELGELERARDLVEEVAERSEAAGTHSGQAEPWANALLGLAESAIIVGDDADAAAWLDRVDDVLSLGAVRFGWRVGLRRDELRSRLEPERAEGLLETARAVGSAKYEALALGLLGRTHEALQRASSTASDLLLARVGPPEIATEAVHRMAGRLPAELRDQFLRRGPAAARVVS